VVVMCEVKCQFVVRAAKLKYNNSPSLAHVIITNKRPNKLERTPQLFGVGYVKIMLPCKDSGRRRVLTMTNGQPAKRRPRAIMSPDIVNNGHDMAQWYALSSSNIAGRYRHALKCR
jgi:hypothetical protein